MIYLQKTVFYKGGIIVRQKIVLQGNSKREQRFNCGKKVE